MQLKMLKKPERSQETFDFGSPFIQKLREIYPNITEYHATWDANDKFQTIVDLVKLYSETNSKVLAKAQQDPTI